MRAAAVEALGHAPGAGRQAILTRALATPSYQDVIGNAALGVIARVDDTTLVPLVNAQVGKLSDAVFVLAVLGRRGSAQAYALLADRLDDPRPTVRSSAGQALLYVVPADMALQLIATEQPKLTRARARVEVADLKSRIEKRAARAH